jgi:SAM-dependent methyltransferase
VSSNTYRALHAAHYDLIYAGKPYAHEARFVAERLPPPGRLLDLACGTGRHAAEFAKLGWDVTGVDYSPDLLERARANAPDARLVEADMRELDLGEQFDAVTCLFDSIGYPQSDEGVIAALSAARRHLAPGGVLAVEYLHTPALLESFDPLKVRRWDADGARLVRVSETRLDAAASVMHVDYELIELRADGSYAEARETQSNRFFTADEFRALLGEAGLAETATVAAYADDPAITADTFHLLTTATAR